MMGDGGLVLDVKGAELIAHMTTLATRREGEAATLEKSLIQSTSRDEKVAKLRKSVRKYRYYAEHLSEGAIYKLRLGALDEIEMFGDDVYMSGC